MESVKHIKVAHAHVRTHSPKYICKIKRARATDGLQQSFKVADLGEWQASPPCSLHILQSLWGKIPNLALTQVEGRTAKRKRQYISIPPGPCAIVHAHSPSGKVHHPRCELGWPYYYIACATLSFRNGMQPSPRSSNYGGQIVNPRLFMYAEVRRLHQGPQKTGEMLSDLQLFTVQIRLRRWRRRNHTIALSFESR